MKQSSVERGSSTEGKSTIEAGFPENGDEVKASTTRNGRGAGGDDVEGTPVILDVQPDVYDVLRELGYFAKRGRSLERSFQEGVVGRKGLDGSLWTGERSIGAEKAQGNSLESDCCRR